MRLPTHLSTSSLGSRCDTLPPCCLVGSAIAALWTGDDVLRWGAPRAEARALLALPRGADAGRAAPARVQQRCSAGMRAAVSSRLHGGVLAAQAPGPVVSQTRVCVAAPLPRARTAAPAAPRVACSCRAAPPQHRTPLSRGAPGRAAVALRRRASLPLLRARGSGGAEPPPEGDLTPLLVTYGGGACRRCVAAATGHAEPDAAPCVRRRGGHARGCGPRILRRRHVVEQRRRLLWLLCRPFARVRTHSSAASLPASCC